MITENNGAAPLPQLTKPAAAAQILGTYETINGDGEKLTGSMPNNGAVTATIDGLTATSAAVPAGYTSGGTVRLTDAIETALAAI